MTEDPAHEQILALAGVAQFAINAHAIAAHGKDVPEQLDAALATVFTTEPDSVPEAVGEPHAVVEGVQFLRRQFGHKQSTQEDAQIARNMGQVLRLTKRLFHRQEVFKAIRGAIDRARLAERDQAPAILDEVYRTNVSPVSPQIMVNGHPSYLQNAVFEQRIRTHLLAAIRCGVLWWHHGGRFWRLFFMRRRYGQALRDLDTADPGTTDPS